MSPERAAFPEVIDSDRRDADPPYDYHERSEL